MEIRKVAKKTCQIAAVYELMVLENFSKHSRCVKKWVIHCRFFWEFFRNFSGDSGGFFRGSFKWFFLGFSIFWRIFGYINYKWTLLTIFKAILTQQNLGLEYILSILFLNFKPFLQILHYFWCKMEILRDFEIFLIQILRR